jgi:hypothetical protein
MFQEVPWGVGSGRTEIRDKLETTNSNTARNLSHHLEMCSQHKLSRWSVREDGKNSVNVSKLQLSAILRFTDVSAYTVVALPSRFKIRFDGGQTAVTEQAGLEVMLYIAFSSVPPGNSGIVVRRIGHDRFRQNNFQFISHSILRRHSINIKSVVN